MLQYPAPDARLVISVDASQIAAGGVLQQGPPGAEQPLAFFSKTFTKAEQRYSTFGRELLAAYLIVHHFRHYAEAGPITVYTDHKPLVNAFANPTERRNERELRQLEFLSQYDLTFRHISGPANEVADALSRVAINGIVFPDTMDYAHMAAEQKKDGLAVRQSSTTLQAIPIPASPFPLVCDITMTQPRPLVPLSLRRSVFDLLHGLAHPGTRATTRLIANRLTWRGLSAPRCPPMGAFLSCLPARQSSASYQVPEFTLSRSPKSVRARSH